MRREESLTPVPVRAPYLLKSLQLVLEGLSGYLHLDHLLPESFIVVLRFSTLLLHGLQLVVQSDGHIFGYLHWTHGDPHRDMKGGAWMLREHSDSLKGRTISLVVARTREIRARLIIFNEESTAC